MLFWVALTPGRGRHRSASVPTLKSTAACSQNIDDIQSSECALTLKAPSNCSSVYCDLTLNNRHVIEPYHFVLGGAGGPRGCARTLVWREKQKTFNCQPKSEQFFLLLCRQKPNVCVKVSARGADLQVVQINLQLSYLAAKLQLRHLKPQFELFLTSAVYTRNGGCYSWYKLIISELSQLQQE